MKNYLGLKDIYYHFDGVGDPLVEYNGFLFSEWDIQDAVWERWKEYLSDFDYLSNQNYIEPWGKYQLRETKSILTDFLYALGNMDIEYLKRNAPGWYKYLADALYYSDEWAEERYPFDYDVLQHYSGVSFVVEDFVSV